LEKRVLQKFCKTRLCGTLTYIKTSGNESSREKNSHALGVAEYTAIGRDRTEYESADRGAREAVVLHSLLIEQAHAVALFQHGVTVLLRDNVSAFSYMVRQTNNSGLLAI